MPRRIKGTGDIHIKPGWEERYRALTGVCYDEFMEYSLSYLTRSIRVNTLKTTVEEMQSRLKDKWQLRQIPWCREGFWIEGERRDVGNLIEHMLGYLYVQEAASMIPPIVLDPQPGELVMDMCASPGSKATQIAAMMNNEGLLVANDISGGRMKPLGINMQRAGIKNAMITQNKGHRFRTLGVEFDRILVDAPCSGTGTVRKSLKTLQIWNPNMIRRMCSTQKTLIDTAFNLLKQGGTMVYSTCSLEPEEDEGVIDFLVKKYPNASVEEIDLPIKRGEAVTEWEGATYSEEVKKTLRIWPQDNDTEGFFVAKIRKR